MNGDEDVLSKAREGDRDALARLLGQHQQRLLRFGMKMCGREEDAQDVLQETFIAAARTIRDFRGASSVSTWLYTIARSFCLKRHRGERSTAGRAEPLDAGSGAHDVVDSRDGPEEAAASKQLRAALQRAISALDPMYREVLVLRDVEGLSAAEVAEIVNVSVDAVKSRLHRARIAVRQQLAPLLGIPEPAAAAPASATEKACPDVVELFSRHLEGEISDGVCSALEEHLRQCDRCRARCDSLRATLNLCSQSGQELPVRVERSVRDALRRFIEANG